MRSSLGLRLACRSCWFLLALSGFACSGSEPNAESSGGGSGSGGHSGSAPSAAGTPSAGTGSGVGGGATSGGAGAATAGTAAGGTAPSNAGSAGHSSAGMAGTAAGGAHAGSAAGGSAGSASVAGSAGTSSAAMCDMIKTEYAAELAKQLECKPGAGSRAEASLLNPSRRRHRCMIAVSAPFEVYRSAHQRRMMRALWVSRACMKRRG